MREDIFRKKSLDKLRSPESLDECIKVTNPGVWLMLATVVLLLIGACAWGTFGRIDSTVPVRVRAENGVLSGTVAEENVTAVKPGMTVRFAAFEATVESTKKEGGGYTLEPSANETVPDGAYDGHIVIESFKPFSFVLN